MYPKYTLTFVRHGESEGNVVLQNPDASVEDREKILRSPSPLRRLTPKGVEQAKALTGVIDITKYQRTVVSPFLRAQETALSAFGRNTVWEIDSLIRERLVQRESDIFENEWNNVIRAQIDDYSMPGYYSRPRGCEAMVDVETRMRQFLSDCQSNSESQAGEIKKTLIVTHAHFMWTVRKYLENLSFNHLEHLQNLDRPFGSITNCAVMEYQFSRPVFVPRYLLNVRHSRVYRSGVWSSSGFAIHFLTDAADMRTQIEDHPRLLS